MKQLIVICILTLFVGVAQADDLKFTWNAYQGTDAVTFLIKQDTDTNVFHTVTDLASVEAIVPASAGLDCHNYWIVAVNGDGVESLRGTVLSECPGEGPPPVIINRPLIINGFGIERITIE